MLFILFYPVLFYYILFHSILLYSILFYSILIYSIMFYSILFYFIIFYSILFYSILFYSPRGVLPTVVRRCVWSRNFVNEALAHWGLSRQKKNVVFSHSPVTSSLYLSVRYLEQAISRRNFFVTVQHWAMYVNTYTHFIVAGDIHLTWKHCWAKLIISV